VSFVLVFVIVAMFQRDPNFGRILATDGGVFVAGSLAWGVIVDEPNQLPVICLNDTTMRCWFRRRSRHTRPGTGPLRRACRAIRVRSTR
jgi:Uncharacterised BCR, YnfA/UPF0060 family